MENSTSTDSSDKVFTGLGKGETKLKHSIYQQRNNETENKGQRRIKPN